MSERIAYQFNGDHVLKFAGMQKLTGEQVADELNRLYTIIAEKNEQIAEPEREAEPVAWMTTGDFRSATVSSAVLADWKSQGLEVAPLYAAPQPAEQQPSPHPDDAAVDRFAAAMKAKLTKKRQEGRGGWQSMTAEQLSALLHEHVRKGDPVDVGNLAMMLHQNEQGIEQKPAPDVTQLMEALEQIERWDGFPSTGEVWEDSGEPVSYGAAFGSNGERDFMREVARKALAAYRKGGE